MSDRIEGLEEATQRDDNPSWLIHEAIARIAGLEVQLAEALEALEPFAMVAEHDISEDETDSDTYRPMQKPLNRAPQITVGHIRAARRALEGGE